MFSGSSHIRDNDPRSPKSQRTKDKQKNPYSNRGLDRFAKLKADLEARREKIKAQLGEQDVSLIRFVHSNSDGWVPIVVKGRQQAKKDAVHPMNHPIQQNLEEAGKKIIGSSTAKDVVKSDAKMKKSFSWGLNKNETTLWKSCYWPLVVILILVCLVLFGRSFAIICTSIGWYLVPTYKDTRNMNMRRSMKKDYDKRFSDKKFGSSGRISLQSRSHGSIIT